MWSNTIAVTLAIAIALGSGGGYVLSLAAGTEPLPTAQAPAQQDDAQQQLPAAADIAAVDDNEEHDKVVAQEEEAPEEEPQTVAEDDVAVQNAAPLLEDIMVRAMGEEDGGFHETWTWNVESDAFQAFEGVATMDFAGDALDLFYCVEAILRDASGQVVQRRAAQADFFDDDGSMEFAFDILAADLPEDSVMLGEWSLTLHVNQGTVAYNMAVDVLY